MDDLQPEPGPSTTNAILGVNSGDGQGILRTTETIGSGLTDADGILEIHWSDLNASGGTTRLKRLSATVDIDANVRVEDGSPAIVAVREKGTDRPLSGVRVSYSASTEDPPRPPMTMTEDPPRPPTL